MIQKILDRIVKMREARGWSEYQLSVQAGMLQSTISGWYTKGKLPTIPSLEKICGAFGITLSQLFAEESDTVTLTEKQKELLDNWIHLETAQQEALLAFLKLL